jgi:hypothetical protein
MNVTIEGHAGGDAELKTASTGREYAQFSMAVSFGKKDDPKKHTLWVRCMAFHAAKEQAMDLVKKGNPLVVRGDMAECSAYISNKTNAPAVGAMMFVNTVDPYVVEQREEYPQSVPQVAPTPTEEVELPF